MITVGIIDDGIRFDKDLKISKSIEITQDLEVKEVKKSDSIHGSTCAAIIQKYYKRAVFDSIKVLYDMTGSKNQLVKAIEWCINNRIKVLNISLGTTSYGDFEDIKRVIDEAYENNIIIIAACDNRNVFTYPASYRKVIGVKCSDELKEGQYIFNLYPLDGADITSCSRHKLLSKDWVTGLCNSYAAPMITAKVCEILDDNPELNLEEIKDKLYENSLNYNEDILRICNPKDVDYIDLVNHFYNEDVEKRDIDIPLIIVYSYEKDKLIDVLEKIACNFKDDGYYALEVCTELAGIKHGMHYIPLEEAENMKCKLEALYRVYNCDLMILGIIVERKQYDYINIINEVLEDDICIFILNKFDENYCEVLKKYDEAFFIGENKYVSNKNFIYKNDETNLLYKRILKRLK